MFLNSEFLVFSVKLREVLIMLRRKIMKNKREVKGSVSVWNDGIREAM